MSYKKMLKAELLEEHEILLEEFEMLEDELTSLEGYAVDLEHKLCELHEEIVDLRTDGEDKIAFLCQREDFDREDYEKIMYIINEAFQS